MMRTFTSRPESVTFSRQRHDSRSIWRLQKTKRIKVHKVFFLSVKSGVVGDVRVLDLRCFVFCFKAVVKTR